MWYQRRDGATEKGTCPGISKTERPITMSLWNKISWVFGVEHEDNADYSIPFKQRYAAFQSLLASNNAVLEKMADMEEKLSGEYLFDRRYLESGIGTITEGVRNIVGNINVIAKNKYATLADRADQITAQLQGLLKQKTGIAVDKFTVPFSEITKEAGDRVGSKIANLGEIRNRASLPVPDGFGITSYAFKHFMEHNGFLDKINEKLAALAVGNIDSLISTSREIQQMISAAEVPPDLEKEIRDAYERLCAARGSSIPVSVRSSALQEDGEFSFAGQYSTFLNVTGDSIIQKYKEVVGSLFNQRALFYFKTKGFQDYDMVMPVGVLTMIDARAGGVMYSQDPNAPKDNVIIISSIRGLGVCVVDGTVTPETYHVARNGGFKVVDRNLPAQTAMAVCRADGGIDRVAVDASLEVSPSLSDDDIRKLSEYAAALEKHFRAPQDIEWAIDKDNLVHILQSRPLRILARETSRPVPTRVKGYDILVDRGAIACKGIAFGAAHHVRIDEDLKNFPDGGVLIARHTSTKFVTVMNRASAIITDVGSTTGHMASLSREFQVPTILDAGNATSVIKNGQEITVDAINCNVYHGRVKELEEFAVRKEDPFKETQLFKTLERSLKLIAPLSLVDPEAENFKPEGCVTLHDITRFCHEMAVRELFNVVDTSADDVGAVKLVAAIPMEIYLLDLGGGIEGSPKHVNPEHIASVPFKSFLKGLTAMKWPEARAFDVKGFLGAVAHTATISEDEIQKTAEKSFSFIGSNYMNFAIRLGYHLSTVEAYIGDSINDNYIRFFFKGGGAVVDRRLRRVRLIEEILRCMDFNVKVSDDVLEASLMKYKRETLEQKIEVMGRFTVYTKQLDMVMYNDMITESYIAEFCRLYIPKEDHRPRKATSTSSPSKP